MVEKLTSALHKQHGLKSATILLVVTLFLSNVLGLIRNILLASHSQSLGQLDTYYAAFRLPDLVFNILILGSISSAFIPVYTGAVKEKGDTEATKLANTLLGMLLALVFVGVIIIWFATPSIIPLLVSKFTLNQQSETIHLTRIMLLSPLFFTFSYVAGAVLNSHKRFVAYSIAPLIYNCSIIVGALLLPKYGVYGVAWAVVVGAALHFLIQVPTLASMNFHIRPRFAPADRAVAHIISLTIPRTFSLLMVQVSLLGFTVIASGLRPGAITIFSLVNDLQTTPAVIFGASLATAAFPSLSESVAEKSPSRFQHYLHRTLRVSVFMVVPLTILVYLLRAQIMRLYIGLGHNIGWPETVRAIQTLTWFSFSFVAQATVFILARSFYALQDTKRPMYASLIGTALTLLLAVTLPLTSLFASTGPNDVASLAAAYTFGMWTQAILLFWWLPKLWKGNLTTFFASAVRVITIGVASGLATWLTLQFVGEGLKLDRIFDIDFNGIGTDTVLKLIIQGGLASVIGVLTFAVLARLWVMDELQWVFKVRDDQNDKTVTK